MSDTAARPRNIIGMVLITLVLGAGPLMMWLGRGRAAIIYYAAGIIALVAFFLGAANGFPSTAIFGGAEPDLLLSMILLPIGGIGFVHGLAIRKTALSRSWYSRWYVALPGLLVLSTAGAFAIRTFLFQPFNALSSSMEPNLILGDYFFVSKTAYRKSGPRRGDIAVFKLPSNPSIDYVKRVIGLPGDRVQMIDGVLYINGAAVTLEPVELPAPFNDATRHHQYFRETLPGGRSYVIADDGKDGLADNTAETVVPDGHYFVMGDNRDNSMDSRFDQTGLIPLANFTGSFTFRFWNAEGFPLTNRPPDAPAAGQ